MTNIIKQQTIEKKLIEFKNHKILLDFDVAELYAVETKRVNEAVKNNPEKFPVGCIIEISTEEWISLKSKISTLKNKGRGQHTKFNPKGFTEKGLYMLATVLKSKQATKTTIAIIETFAKVRELTKTINTLSTNPEEKEQKSLMTKSGEIISELLDNELQTTGTETTMEINFAVLKFKHTIKKEIAPDLYLLLNDNDNQITTTTKTTTKS